MSFDVKILGMEQHELKLVDIERSSRLRSDDMARGRRTGAIDEASEPDGLDEALVIWAREIPDLDPLTEGIVERIDILAHALKESMEQTLAEFDLDHRNFRVLGRLRSYGPPYQRSAGLLASDMRLSSGAMTNRLDRMEEAGLIRRLPDPMDRRGTLIEPTEAGHAAWDKTAGTQARREARIAAALTLAEREQLHDLLRTLMREFPDKAKKHFAGRPEGG